MSIFTAEMHVESIKISLANTNKLHATHVSQPQCTRLEMSLARKHQVALNSELAAYTQHLFLKCGHRSIFLHGTFAFQPNSSLSARFPKNFSFCIRCRVIASSQHLSDPRGRSLYPTLAGPRASAESQRNVKEPGLHATRATRWRLPRPGSAFIP